MATSEKKETLYLCFIKCSIAFELVEGTNKQEVYDRMMILCNALSESLIIENLEWMENHVMDPMPKGKPSLQYILGNATFVPRNYSVRRFEVDILGVLSVDYHELNSIPTIICSQKICKLSNSAKW